MRRKSGFNVLFVLLSTGKNSTKQRNGFLLVWPPRTHLQQGFRSEQKCRSRTAPECSATRTSRSMASTSSWAPSRQAPDDALVSPATDSGSINQVWFEGTFTAHCIAMWQFCVKRTDRSQRIEVQVSPEERQKAGPRRRGVFQRGCSVTGSCEQTERSPDHA